MKVQDLRPNLEPLARFAHEGLPYMKDGDNWFDFDKKWALEIWWDATENTWRATAYLKEEDGEVNTQKGFDLF